MNIGSVRLVSKKSRIVEVLGPEPPGSRRPTDRELLIETYQSRMELPQRVGFCSQADGRRARFLVDKGSLRDQLLDRLAKHPKTPARPYGVKGWLVEG